MENNDATLKQYPLLFCTRAGQTYKATAIVLSCSLKEIFDIPLNFCFISLCLLSLSDARLL